MSKKIEKIQTLDVGEVIAKGWQIFKENVGFYSLIGLICFAIHFLIKVLFKGGFLSSALTYFVNAIFGIIFISLSIEALKEEKIPISIEKLVDYLKKNLDVLLIYIIASFLYTVAVGIGLVLLIVPGIFLAVKLYFYPFEIILKKPDDLFESFKKSYEITKGNFFPLLILGIIIGIIMGISAIPMGLGLIFTVPFSWAVGTVTYVKLTSELEKEKTNVETENQNLNEKEEQTEKNKEKTQSQE